VKSSTLEPSDEDILVEVGKDVSGGGVAAPMDNLKVPPIADNDGHEGDDINENEDQLEKDAYPTFNMNDLLGLFVCINHL